MNGHDDGPYLARAARARHANPVTPFRVFVCVSLSLLVGLHVYAYLWGPHEIATSISDVKYFVMQLSREISQVHRKHERLQSEVERVSSALPAVAAAAGRAKEALRPAHANSRHSLADYDRQMGDYALESAGARVLGTGDTVGHFHYDGPVSWALHELTAWACHECQAARAVIQPGTLPGQCWAFKGERGEVVIRLLATVHVTGLSLEHIPPHIDPTREILSAPRQFQLEGLKSRTDTSPHDFGIFEYNKNGNPIQYFDVTWQAPQGFNIVRFKVLSNWGHPVYTCVYRVRVHGDLLPGQAPQSRVTVQEEARIDIG
ncbi:SUN domain-containing protein 1-like [Cydia amplana]|uniref:SUN domain-containing protein 1-like n=1 Tax=Cydia amplana TaxID=1869771 RepID=UPI002FE5E2C3